MSPDRHPPFARAPPDGSTTLRVQGRPLGATGGFRVPFAGGWGAGLRWKVSAVAGGAYVVESSTTGDVAPRERADFWSEHIATYQESRMSYRYSRADDFRGET